MAYFIKSFSVYLLLSVSIIILLAILFFFGKLNLIECLLIWILSIILNFLLFKNDILFFHNLNKDLSLKIKSFKTDKIPKSTYNNFINTNYFNILGNKLSAVEKNYQDKLIEFDYEIKQNSFLIDSLPVAIITFNKNFNIKKANRVAIEILGKDIINTDIRQIFRQPEILELIDKASKGDIKDEKLLVEIFGLPPQFWSFQIFLFSKTHINKNYITQDFDEAIGSVLMTNHTLEKSLEKTRSDFVANVSHELRTPLTSILGYTETLMTKSGDDQKLRNKFLRVIEKQTKRMTRLISDQLSLAKIETKEHKIPSKSVNLKLVISEVLDFLSKEIESLNISVVKEVNKNSKNIRGNKEEIFQVILNLVENAIRYSGKESTITVKLDIAKTKPNGLSINSWPAMCLEIKDNGPGIDKAHIGRLTERFYRVDASRSKEIGGTGLGLAIVKHIINRHRGLLIIESELKVGSKFSIYLKNYKK